MFESLFTVTDILVCYSSYFLRSLNYIADKDGSH